MKLLRLAVLACLLTSLVFAQETKKKFTVEEIFGSRKFMAESLRNVHWTKNGRSFFYNDRDSESRSINIMRYDVKSGKREVVVQGKNLSAQDDKEPFRFQHTIWSPDERHILFTGTHRARRTKSGGDFYLYDVQSGKLKQLTDTDEMQVNVNFSPDGASIAFVRANNLMLMDLASGAEKQLTFDGAEHVLNGHFDWVYEEEFGIIEGWHWSPDGRHIAYWQLDENRVPEFDIVLYDSLHLNWNHMRYPKAGDPNSIVRIGVVDIESAETIWMDLGAEDDIYIPRIYWLPDASRLVMLRLNRLQNHVEILLGDPATGATEVIFTERSDTWLDIEDGALRFLSSKKQFIWTSDRDGFNHVYIYGLDGGLIRQITTGEWEVRSVEGIDDKRGFIYFMATEKSPLESHLYRIKFDGTGLQRLTKTDGWHRVDFSPNHDYFLDNYSDAATPTRTGLFSVDGELEDVLVENDLGLHVYEISPTEFLTVATSDSVILNALMIKPADFDPGRKYPLLMYVYGGPGSQTVRNSWGGSGFLWYQLLTQEGYIVASVDNRGTGGRGAEFKKLTYKNLGHWEVHDQIEAAKFFGALPYIDAGRIGISGWSYGGYMAAFCLFRGHDVFKMAISGAPVTSWRFYDTIYTERYMQTPQLNPEGYEKSAPLNYAKDLKGELLLIHGTADDNVHFQNTVRLAEKLIKHGKQFRTMFYPGEYHGVRQGRLHLQTLMTNFILEKL